MTRRKLWSLTVLVCLLLTLPSLPMLPKGWWDQGRALAIVWGRVLGVRAQQLAQPAQHRAQQLAQAGVAAIAATWRVSLPIAVGVALVGLTVMLLIRERRNRARQVRRLARQGRPVAAIARRTRLAQDVVRDLLGSDAETTATDQDFGDLLRASSMLPGA